MKTSMRYTLASLLLAAILLTALTLSASAIEILSYFQITVMSDNYGTVSGGGRVLEDSNVTVTATPNYGYSFSNWSEGGTVVSLSPSYSFTAEEDRTLVANFRKTAERKFSFGGIEYKILTEPALGSTDDGAVEVSGRTIDTATMIIPPRVADGIHTYRVVGIGKRAFADYETLEYITLPNTLEYIEDRAFYDCNLLQHIDIPASVTRFGKYAFRSCSQLHSVVFAEDSPLTTLSLGLFEGCGSLDRVVLPPGVKTISDSAFAITYLDDDGIADVLRYATTLKEQSISWNKRLRNVVIPANVTNIGRIVLEACENLESITVLYDGPKTIHAEAFAKTSSSPTVTHKLAPVERVTVNPTAKTVSWTGNPYAEKYIVTFYAEDGATVHQMTVTGTSTGYRLPTGNHTCGVVAVGPSSFYQSANYQNSDEVRSPLFAHQNQKIATPVLTVNETTHTISWNWPQNTSYLMVTLRDSTGKALFWNMYFDNEFVHTTVCPESRATGEYTIEVVAVDMRKATSGGLDQSDPGVLTFAHQNPKLGTPQVSYDPIAAKITWPQVDDAEYYNIEILHRGQAVASIPEHWQSNYDLSTLNLTVGEPYQVRVQAKDRSMVSAGGFDLSDWGETTFNYNPAIEFVDVRRTSATTATATLRGNMDGLFVFYDIKYPMEATSPSTTGRMGEFTIRITGLTEHTAHTLEAIAKISERHSETATIEVPAFMVTKSRIGDGELGVDKPYAEPGETVTVTLAAVEGNKFSHIQTNPAGLALTKTSDTTYTFTMPNKGTVELTAYFVAADAAIPAMPVIVPNGGKVGASTEIAITAEDDAEIYYTLDGTTPSAASTRYTAPFTLAQSALVRAVAVKDGLLSPAAEVNFTLIHTVALSVDPSGGGSVSGGGDYATGETVTLTATPARDYRFIAWFEDDSLVSSSATYHFPANADRTLRALFAHESAQQEAVYIVSFDPGEGSLELSGALTGEGGVLADLPTPTRPGYDFGGWSLTPDGEPLPEGYVFTGNATIYAIWRESQSGSAGETDERPTAGGINVHLAVLILHRRTFDIEATAGEGGTITSAGVTEVRYSRNQTYTITPDEGFEIVSVIVDGKDVGAVSEYTFRKVQKKHTISAVFAQIVEEVEEPDGEQIVDGE